MIDGNRAVPIIRIEIEHMRHTMATMLGRYAAQLDETMQKAVEAYCQPENLERIINAAAKESIDRAITEEIDKFYRYGDGRKVIAEAVKANLAAKA